MHLTFNLYKVGMSTFRFRVGRVVPHGKQYRGYVFDKNITYLVLKIKIEKYNFN